MAMAVAAGPSASGAWTAVVGDPDLGLAAVGELGVALERLMVVRPEPDTWSSPTKVPMTSTALFVTS